MKQLLTSLLTASSLFCSYSILVAQDDCKNSLYEANILFETGKLQSAIDRLVPCINRGMLWEERFESYRLLALTYQNLKDEENAEVYILKMLRMKPDYLKLPNNDPPDFTRLVEQFGVEEKLILGVKIGMSFNQPKLIQSYSFFQTPQRYALAPGFSIGLSADHHFNTKWHLRGTLFFKGTAIQHQLTNESGWEKSYTDNLRLWEVNLAPRYSFSECKKIKPFVGMSAGLGKISSSHIIMETKHPDGQFDYNSQNGLASKNLFQPFVGLLAGFQLPLARGAVEVEISYSLGLSLLTQETKRFDNPDFIFNAQYVVDDVRMMLLEVSASYTLPQAYRIQKR